MLAAQVAAETADVVLDELESSEEDAERGENTNEAAPSAGTTGSTELAEVAGAGEVADASRRPEPAAENNSDEDAHGLFDNFVLAGVDVRLEGPSLVAVCGAVGAGKSTLLESILGETNIFSGTREVLLRGSVAYVPQSAWILNDTVRANILLSKEYVRD